MEIIKTDYANWLNDLKQKIKTSQINATLAVNKELIVLYWEIGKQIDEKLNKGNWGSGIINQLSIDLRKEFESITGFSKSNLYAMKQFYQTYNLENSIFHQAGGKLQVIDNQYLTIFHQAGGKLENENDIPDFVENYCYKLPWRHIVLALQKIKTKQETIFYFKETVKNNWSRDILNLQIESNLFNRQGKAITNFKNTLPALKADLLNETLKNPYNFDFLTLEENAQEKDIEKGLVENISKFIIELGKGFAFLGRQYKIEFNDREHFIDMLFYHTKLHCYVVIELKIGEFEPEHIGKLNFYLSAVNSTLKTDVDEATIGILLCKNKNELDVEFSLQDINKPIGVSEFTFLKNLPLELQKQMPTVAELEQELMKFNLDG